MKLRMVVIKCDERNKIAIKWIAEVIAMNEMMSAALADSCL